MSDIWIDILNPSHPLFFRPVLNRFSRELRMDVTIRERGETVKLARSFGIEGKVVGKDYEGRVRKILSIILRSMQLQFSVKRFDTALSFENPMSVAVARFRKKKSILMLDNDLKYKIEGNYIQKQESRLKSKATHIVVPEACRKTFGEHMDIKKLEFYDGYKEDVYIASHQPDPDFMKNLPFENYFVIRPEALASFYVKGKESLVPDLLKMFAVEGKNVVLLPRDKSDSRFQPGDGVHVPPEPLNGLDLIHYSKGVLTGSGTMAREAAVMGRPAVSFFPESRLLSVDESLIEKGWMHHSRNIDDILDHLKKGRGRPSGESKKVQEEVFTILGRLMEV